MSAHITIAPRDPPDVVIVIVTYNSAVDIAVCVQSIAQHFLPLAEGRAEVHVVDNASTDETPAILARLASIHDWLKLHNPPKNLGFGVGNNLVLNGVGAGAYILLNADAWLLADSFSPALAHLHENPKTGVIGLPLVYPDGAPQSYVFLPSAWHRWLLFILAPRRLAKILAGFAPTRTLMRLLPFSRNFITNHAKPAIALDDPAALSAMATGAHRNVAWVAGAAMALSANFIRDSRGFDPDIFLYGEDEDLCIQARALGYKVKTLQTVPVVHRLGWGGAGGFRARVACMKYESLKYFITKNVSGAGNRALMRALLPLYVYGRNIRHFFRRGT